MTESQLDKELEALLQNKQELTLRQTLDRVDKAWEYPAGKQKGAIVRSLSSLRSVLAIAAGLAILVLAGLSFWLNQADPNPEDLYAAYITPYEMSLINRTASSEQQAALAYSAADYKAAAGLYAELVGKDSTDVQSVFFAGISALLAHDSYKAVLWLNDLSRRPEHLFSEQSRWYLALAYLKLNQPEKAKSTLLDLKEGAYKYEEAQALLQELE